MPMKEPGFLERGFICIGAGVRFADSISFFLKHPMKMKSFGLIETKSFHFHKIFKNWGQGGENCTLRFFLLASRKRTHAVTAFTVRLACAQCIRHIFSLCQSFDHFKVIERNMTSTILTEMAHHEPQVDEMSHPPPQLSIIYNSGNQRLSYFYNLCFTPAHQN